MKNSLIALGVARPDLRPLLAALSPRVAADVNFTDVVNAVGKKMKGLREKGTSYPKLTMKVKSDNGTKLQATGQVSLHGHALQDEWEEDFHYTVKLDLTKDANGDLKGAIELKEAGGGGGGEDQASGDHQGGRPLVGGCSDQGAQGSRGQAVARGSGDGVT